jgi:hypothetical protein
MPVRFLLSASLLFSIFQLYSLTIVFSLFQDHISEVMSKWHSIDDEIWAKLIVLERNRRVAKAYARAPVLTVNGSDDGFDGFRIGVAGFDNPMRDAKTDDIIRHIGQVRKITIGVRKITIGVRIGNVSSYKDYQRLDKDLLMKSKAVGNSSHESKLSGGDLRRPCLVVKRQKCRNVHFET